MTERDERIARALRELPIPDHGPTFWADLDRRLDEPLEPATARAAAARVVDPPVHRLDTGELPSVAALDDGRRRRRSRRAPLLAAAAAVVVLAAAVGVVTFLGDDDEPTEVADRPRDPVTTTVGGATTMRAVSTTTTTPATDTATGTVQAWLRAIGEGDIAAAAALTGPVTTAYFAAFDGVEGYLTEAQEGYGAWADVPDAEYAELALGPVGAAGADVSVVVVTGANRGEGRDEPVTTDVFPVVDRGEGWRVEPVAGDPDRDTNIPIVQSPRAPQGASGLGSMAGDAAVEVIVPAAGTVVFQIDSLEPYHRATTGVGPNDDPYARYDPPGTLPGGTHTLVVVGIGDDGTIAAVAGPFTVTGAGTTTTSPPSSTTTTRTGTTSTTGGTGTTTSTTR